MSFLNNDVFPAGIVLPFAGSAAPAGWLLCNTATPVAIASYPRLHAAIGNSYNGGVTPGDGVTTFNLPNLSGVFPRGAGSQVIGGLTYTATSGTRQNDTTAVKGISLNDPGHIHQIVVNMTAQKATGLAAGPYIGSGVSTTTGITISSTDTETRPANVGVNYIIKI